MTLTEWQIYFLSMLPVTELRATIPLALALGVAPLKAYLLAVLGNLTPIIPILLLLEPVSNRLRIFPVVDRVFRKILARTRQKGRDVQKYGAIGLAIFVAIPLPGTGAWTGAALAGLFGLNYFMSVISIGAGVALAGVLVMLACLGFIQIALIYDLEYVVALIAVFLTVYLWYKRKRR